MVGEAMVVMLMVTEWIQIFTDMMMCTQRDNKRIQIQSNRNEFAAMNFYTRTRVYHKILSAVVWCHCARKLTEKNQEEI